MPPRRRQRDQPEQEEEQQQQEKGRQQPPAAKQNTPATKKQPQQPSGGLRGKQPSPIPTPAPSQPRQPQPHAHPTESVSIMMVRERGQQWGMNVALEETGANKKQLLIVSSVTPGGIAERAGIVVGDVITTVHDGGATPQERKAFIARAMTLRLVVARTKAAALAAPRAAFPLPPSATATAAAAVPPVQSAAANAPAAAVGAPLITSPEPRRSDHHTSKADLRHMQRTQTEADLAHEDRRVHRFPRLAESRVELGHLQRLFFVAPPSAVARPLKCRSKAQMDVHRQLMVEFLAR